MWVYGLLIFVVLILLVFSSIYIAKLTYKLSLNIFKNRKVALVMSIIPLFLFTVGLFIDMVNAIVVDIHLIVIVFIIKLVFMSIKKIFKKEINEYVILGIGIIITVIILVHGYYQAYHVKETNYVLYTEKLLGVDNFRIVQISDSHIGTTMDGNKFFQYMEEINTLKPDIVVLTGDFIDDNTSFNDMVKASKGLGKLKTKYGVYFIYGNHDKGYYNKDNEIKLKRELEKNNVIILEDEFINITDNIILVGRKDHEEKNRKSILDLTKDLDKSKYIIVLNHQPNDYQNEEKAEVDLVLSGHTHGGQLIPLGQLGLLLGANDKIYGMETRGKTSFIVNSGISDWAIKFKTGTISEYGIIDIKKK